MLVESPQQGSTYYLPALNTICQGWIPLVWSDDTACLYTEQAEAQAEVDEFLQDEMDRFGEESADELGVFAVRLGVDGVLYDVEDSRALCTLERD